MKEGPCKGVHGRGKGVGSRVKGLFWACIGGGGMDCMQGARECMEG